MDGLYKTEEICGNTSLTKVESALETEEKKEIAQDGETEPSDNDAQPNEKVEICLNVPADRTAHVFRTALVALVCAVGFSAYAYLGLTAVRAVRERGIGEIAANYVFGGSVVRIEPQTPPTDVDEPEPPSPTAPEVKIDSEDLSVTSVMQFSNETAYDTESLTLPAAVPFPVGAEVLIIHTHTTESYEPYQRAYYDSSYPSRTRDSEHNMIRVGEALAQKLADNGISVLHDGTIHDYPSYTGSYDRSEATIRAALEEYPSIKMILDIHRDAISGGGVRTAPVAEIYGRNAAQFMIITGCDDGRFGNMPEYSRNLSLACAIQDSSEKLYPGLARPVLFDYRNYNQHISTGSLLIEVGSDANSLDEAVYTGELLGDIISAAV